jgi:nicotinamide-nucleotide adenylyltransferase
MQFFRRAGRPISRLGVFPGSFNPPTVAHLALALAALHAVDEVLFVLPRAFPHKPYRDTTLEQRVDLLETALTDSRYSIAVADGGLFIEIARECRAVYGEATKLSFLCGRDAAERIAGWDYGYPGAWEKMLREFDLLVARRGGEYRPESAQSASFSEIPVHPDCDAVSSTEVRRRLAAGESWEHLVPVEIHAKVREFYR